MKSVKFLILIFIIASSLGCVAPGQNQSADVVKLQYGWYPGISASVKFRNTLIHNRPRRKSERVTMDGSYVMRTKKHSAGLQIDCELTDFSVDDNRYLAAKNRPRQVLQKIVGVKPSFVINGNGNLYDILPVGGFIEAIERENSNFVRHVNHPQFNPKQFFLNRLVSKSHVVSRLHKSWERDVGQWINAELRQGHRYSVKFARPVLLFGNQEAPNIGRYEYMGRVPCNRLDQKLSCVKLSYHSKVDDEYANGALTALFKNMEINYIGTIAAKINYDLEVITEERTLIPHYIKEIDSASLVDEKYGIHFEKQDVKEFHYAYTER